MKLLCTQTWPKAVHCLRCSSHKQHFHRTRQSNQCQTLEVIYRNPVVQSSTFQYKFKYKLNKIIPSLDNFYTHSSLFKFIPAYSNLFPPIPAYFILFQPIAAHSSLFQHISAYSSQFKPISAYSSLFQHIPVGGGLIQTFSGPGGFRCLLSYQMTLQFSFSQKTRFDPPYQGSEKTDPPIMCRKMKIILEGCAIA